MRRQFLLLKQLRVKEGLMVIILSTHHVLPLIRWVYQLRLVKAIVLTIARQWGVDGHRFKYSSCFTSNKMSLPVKTIVLTIAGQGGVDGHRFKYSSCSTSNKMSLPIKANFRIFSSFKFRVEGCWFGVLILFYL